MQSGRLGPARLNAPLANQLSGDIAKAVSGLDMREKLLALGIEAVGSTPRQTTAHLRSEIARWTPVMQVRGFEDRIVTTNRGGAGVTADTPH
jgi:tripartite-type tricarboxylate transporter receptor subunit TctC